MPQKDHYHLIGIGGIGMSAIAIALLEKGYSVSGSDIVENELIRKLKTLGSYIFLIQQEKNISFIKDKYYGKNIIIVISSAIKQSNQELKFCLKNNFTIKHRSEILSLLMSHYYSIGVAGTHGKTTTSTFLATLLDLCTKNCSSILGGISPQYNSNANIKDSKYLVVEIDESDRTTSNYETELAIINNIDFDHCDQYTNLDEVICSFKSFANKSKAILINKDCPTTKSNFNSIYTWSIKSKENVSFSMIPKKFTKAGTIADYYEKGCLIGELNLPIPGLHNLSNFTAAFAACRINKIPFVNIKENVKHIKLPKKRFEYRGSYLGRTIVDDYAHHPKEVQATIQLSKLVINDDKSPHKKRLVVIFQPHRYTRVKEFANEFASELSNADLIVLTDIHSAGEKQIKSINSELIGHKIIKKNKNLKYFKNNYEIQKQFCDFTRENDFIVNMGAGDCHNLWDILTINT